MRIQGDDPVIDELLKGRETLFNLIFMIRGDENARLYSDKRSYLTAQTNASTPMWMYVNERADEKTDELFCVFSEALGENADLVIIAEAGAEGLLSRFAKEKGLSVSKRRTMTAYSVKNVREVRPEGKLIASDEQYIPEIAKLVQQMTIDDHAGALTDEEALQFARKHANSENLHLWQDGGVVSMARIVRYVAKYARVTSVVTERKARGNGYAKMLVGELSKRLLAEGIIPVLYANSDNPSSNCCYRHLGFDEAGEVTEFCFDK